MKDKIKLLTLFSVFTIVMFSFNGHAYEEPFGEGGGGDPTVDIYEYEEPPAEEDPASDVDPMPYETPFLSCADRLACAGECITDDGFRGNCEGMAMAADCTCVLEEEHPIDLPPETLVPCADRPTCTDTCTFAGQEGQCGVQGGVCQCYIPVEPVDEYDPSLIEPEADPADPVDEYDPSQIAPVETEQADPGDEYDPAAAGV